MTDATQRWNPTGPSGRDVQLLLNVWGFSSEQNNPEVSHGVS